MSAVSWSFHHLHPQVPSSSNCSSCGWGTSYQLLGSSGVVSGFVALKPSILWLVNHSDSSCLFSSWVDQDLPFFSVFFLISWPVPAAWWAGSSVSSSLVSHMHSSRARRPSSCRSAAWCLRRCSPFRLPTPSASHLELQKRSYFDFSLMKAILDFNFQTIRSWVCVILSHYLTRVVVCCSSWRKLMQTLQLLGDWY